jgi:branched-chain amino acid aminotransferase
MSPLYDREGFLWYDGRLVPWPSATTHVLTHSLHYGLAVFEGLRAYETVSGPAIFRLAEHTDRLLGSARVYRMRIPYDRAELMEAQCAVVRANELSSGYVRPIAFYGAEKLGLNPGGAEVHVAIAAWPWGAYLGPDARSRGVRVKISSYARHHVNVTLPRAKISSTYANSILANVEAIEDGYDEALLLDVNGFVAEGAGENLFIVKDGELVEPELSSALAGITRDTVIALARDRGYRVSARRLTRDDVYLADEAFFAGTAAEITPVVEVDRRAIGDGRPGPITELVSRAYFDAVTGNDPKHLDWVHPVFPSTLGHPHRDESHARPA